MPLVYAGLVEFTMGKAGGAWLARSAAQITHKQIYEAVVGDKPLWSPRENVPSVCVVSSDIEKHFGAISEQAETTALSALDGHTLACPPCARSTRPSLNRTAS